MSTLLDQCKDNYIRVGEALSRLETHERFGWPIKYSEIVETSEKLSVSMRGLCSEFHTIEPPEELDKIKERIIAESSGITWDYINEDNFTLHFPALLHKKRQASRMFFYEEVMSVLDDLLRTHDITKGKGRYIVFDHIINEHRKRKAIDYDNLDTSIVINCLAETIMGNDSPFCYSLFHTATLVDDLELKNSVDMYVLSEAEFVKFILKRYCSGKDIDLQE